MFQSITKTLVLTASTLALTAYSVAASAQAGITTIKTTGDGVIATLASISPLVLLAAIIIAGFLILFRVAGMAVVASVLGGGILIAGAPEIVTWFGL